MIFRTKSDHTAFHQGCDIYLADDVWVAKHKISICPICNTNIKDHKADMCHDCWLKEHSKRIPTRDTLLNLIVTYSMNQIGNMYGVNSNSVRKWCRKYSLPYLQKDIDDLKKVIYHKS